MESCAVSPFLYRSRVLVREAERKVGSQHQDMMRPCPPKLARATSQLNYGGHPGSMPASQIFAQADQEFAG
jgi:hypothetical protein